MGQAYGEGMTQIVLFHHAQGLTSGVIALAERLEQAGHTVRMPEFSSHYPGRAPIYLRRCQSEPAQYEILARELGMDSFLPLLQEWRVLVASYRPSPTFV